MKRAALCVGVNRYHDPEISALEFAQADATELYAFLKRTAGYETVQNLMAPDSDEVLDCAKEMARALAPGDMFVFFFAGHGYESRGRHLLLCPKARLTRLEFFQQTVPVDLLKSETQCPGVDRVFVLDACRKALSSDRGEPGGLGSAQGLRDIVTAKPAGAGGAFTLLCGCAEGEHAREMRHIQRGLFSWAFMEKLEGAARAGAELRLDDACESELRERMRSFATEHGLPGNQHPWIVRSGAAPVLLGPRAAAAGPGRPEGPPRDVDLSGTGQVRCPHCGLGNEPNQTFRCRLCRREHLCLDHFVRAERCCEECVEKLTRERAELHAKEQAAHEAELRQAEADRRLALEQARRQAEAERKAKEEERRRQRWPKPGQAWSNSLGMKFVPGPAPEALICVWQARVADYEAFATATRRSWLRPAFRQDPSHPAANISWEDAKAFCAWLADKERAEGLLGPEQFYRLPGDVEWSWAAGLENERGGTPQERDCEVQGVYPWGAQWPPPKGAGNYAPGLRVDDYEFTSPVGSFEANRYGLYDLGGNLWEWCEDEYAPGSGHRVLRGGCWLSLAIEDLLSSSRSRNGPGARSDCYGFRPVMVAGPSP